MSSPISIHKRRERIKLIGEQLSFRELTLDDKKFLSDALIQIGQGADPEKALGIKGRRGESKGIKARDTADRIELAMTLMAARRSDGEKLEDIIVSLGENGLGLLSLTEETLRTYFQKR